MNSICCDNFVSVNKYFFVLWNKTLKTINSRSVRAWFDFILTHNFKELCRIWQTLICRNFGSVIPLTLEFIHWSGEENVQHYNIIISLHQCDLNIFIRPLYFFLDIKKGRTHQFLPNISSGSTNTKLCFNMFVRNK